MVVGFFHVVGHHVFKGQHAGHIEIPGAGDQVLGVGVFRGQLIADQVAPVVQVFPVDAFILHGLPARGLHAADGAPFLGGHGFPSHIGVGRAAAAQAVQFTVAFKGFLRLVLIREIRHIVVQHHIGLVGEGREGGQIEGGLVFPHLLGDFGAVFGRGFFVGSRFGGSAGGEHQGQGNQEGGQESGDFFHFTYTSSVIFSWEEPGKSVEEIFRHPSFRSMSKKKSPG